MIYVDFSSTTADTISALAEVAKALPRCGPCERNCVYADDHQSVHTIGTMLVLVHGERRASITAVDLVHLHVSEAQGDTEKAREEIIDALTALFRKGHEARDRVLAAFGS